MVTWSIVTEKVRMDREIARIRSMMDNAPINIMCADKQGVIQYLNPKSESTLRGIESLLPIAVDDIVGHSFDVFHKDPPMQRRMIRDDSALPHSAVIELGEERLDLLVSGMYDSEGEYVGPMVTWDVITQRLRQEEELAAAQERERKSAEELEEKVQAILSVVTQAAEGDLTHDVTVSGEDPVGQVGHGLQRLIESLRESINAISSNASTLASAAESSPRPHRRCRRRRPRRRGRPRSSRATRRTSPVTSSPSRPAPRS